MAEAEAEAKAEFASGGVGVGDARAPGDLEKTPGKEEPQEVRVALHTCTGPHDEQQDEESVRDLRSDISST